MTVAIITDSAAALPESLTAQHGITVIPMWVTARGTSSHETDVPLAGPD